MSDYTTEVPRCLLHVESRVELPAYVQEKAWPQPEELQKVASVAFADPVRRELPCRDAAETYLSACDFYARDNQDATVGARLEKLASTFGITADIAKIKEALQDRETIKEASAEDEFALVISDFAGTTPVGMFKVSSAEDVGMSMEEFTHSVRDDKLPWQWARDVAQALVKKAQEASLAIPETVRRMGHEGTIDTEASMKLLEKRARAVLDKDYIETYSDLVKRAATADAEKLDSLYECMYTLDKAFGVKYGFGLRPDEPRYQPTPHEIVLAGVAEVTQDELEKAAKEVIMASDVLVPIEKFHGLPELTVLSVFGEKSASVIMTAQKSEATEASALIRTLPAVDQIDLLRLLTR